ncbi:MAG: adenylosuccinate synthetase [Anaerolineales bacterium]
MRAYIVVDLGFGDAGKGLLTDFLVRKFNAGVVVRYNGGAQAGHNVITPDGRHHTFSQFGSGTFIPGVKTYLSKHVVIHPGALLIEGDVLKRKGVQDVFSRLRVSDQALVITPFHQAANRIREIMRGENCHGSCGVGVGETVEDSQLFPEDSILGGDLSNSLILKKKLLSIRKKKRDQLFGFWKDKTLRNMLERERDVFEREEVIDNWISSISRIRELGIIVSDSTLKSWLHDAEFSVFEGAQGVLLDADAGFHPFTTWSNCTSDNALEIIAEMAPESNTTKIGVIRSYMVRHGPGPLPTETNELNSVVSEHNKHNEWQGSVRYGWFDTVLARYALSVIGNVDSLAVTHLDMLRHQKTWDYCLGYQGQQYFDAISGDSDEANGFLKSFRLSRLLSLEQRTQITQALFSVVPLIKSCKANEEIVIQKIEELIGQTVGIVSRGPISGDVQIIKPIS